ncbi:MAG: PRC-barrel domain-containing protein [Candidatus Thermoplasmatota archaeon]|nr:PRC-barrel domain-containing protein [Candidatus Thermoplasmatota archaeon]
MHIILGEIMVKEIGSFRGLRVYTKDGVYIGKVDNIALDLPNRRIRGLLLTGTNPNLVEGGRSVLVPYRWVSAAGDITLLNFFPQKVSGVEAEENK